VFAETGTWRTPTLIRERTEQLCDAPEFSDGPNLTYMPPATVKTWTKAARTFARFPAEARATFRAGYDVLLRLTKILDHDRVGQDGRPAVHPRSPVHRGALLTLC
jgi:hypothetical protein